MDINIAFIPAERLQKFDRIRYADNVSYRVEMVTIQRPGLVLVSYSHQGQRMLDDVLQFRVGMDVAVYMTEDEANERRA